MPLAGRPFLTFMLDWLHGHGVDDVVLSCGFLSAGVRRVLGDIYQGMRLRYVVEEEPLGTAGPVRLALDEGILEDRLIVANGDVLTDIDLTAQIAWHEERGARATLGARGGGRHEQLRRGAHGRGRPRGGLPREERRGSHEPDQRRRLRARARRDRGDPRRGGRCPSSARSSRRWRASRSTATRPDAPYWIDIGTPERYLEATWDLLAGRVASTLPERDETGSLVLDGSLVAGAHVGPQSVLGRSCSVGTDALRRARGPARPRDRGRGRRRARERARRARARRRGRAGSGRARSWAPAPRSARARAWGRAPGSTPACEVEAGGRVGAGQTLAAETAPG